MKGIMYKVLFLLLASNHMNQSIWAMNPIAEYAESVELMDNESLAQIYRRTIEHLQYNINLNVIEANLKCCLECKNFKLLADRNTYFSFDKAITDFNLYAEDLLKSLESLYLKLNSYITYDGHEEYHDCNMLYPSRLWLSFVTSKTLSTLVQPFSSCLEKITSLWAKLTSGIVNEYYPDSCSHFLLLHYTPPQEQPDDETFVNNLFTNYETLTETNRRTKQRTIIFTAKTTYYVDDIVKKFYAFITEKLTWHKDLITYLQASQTTSYVSEKYTCLQAFTTILFDKMNDLLEQITTTIQAGNQNLTNLLDHSITLNDNEAVSRLKAIHENNVEILQQRTIPQGNTITKKNGLKNHCCNIQ